MQTMQNTASASDFGALSAADLRASFAADGTAWWSPTIAGFARGGSPVDPVGLATVLTFGCALSTRTVLRGVSTDAVDASTFAAPRAPRDSEIIELTVEAVRAHLAARAARQDPIVLLSGGRDSRLILLAMRALGRSPRAVLTLDQRGSESDAAVAERVAWACGRTAERVRAQPFSATRELDRHLEQSFQSLEHGWFVPVAARVRALGGCVTDGIGAGVLSTGSLLDPQAMALWRERRIAELAEWTANHGGHVSRRFMEAARAEGLPLANADEVLHEFAATMKSLDGVPNPLGMYSLLHWTRRGIAASAYGLLPAESAITPLYDRALCQALAAIPMHAAMARDWREIVLAELDATGIPYARGESTRMPRWLAHPVRSIRSRLAWGAFVRGLPAPLARLARIADESPWPRKTFDRAAVGLLASLDRSTGFLSGGTRGS